MNSKKNQKTKYQRLTIHSAILGAVFLTGCATGNKGPKTYEARTYQPARQGIVNSEIYVSPRQKVGQVMDPQATTFAQVPKRILFLPGEQGITSRVSSTQEVKYDLVPVAQIPEIQSQVKPTVIIPSTERTVVTSNNQEPREISIMEEGQSEPTLGKARILEIREQSQEELAKSLLRTNKEQAKYVPPYGWIAWTNLTDIQSENVQQGTVEETQETKIELELPPLEESPVLEEKIEEVKEESIQEVPETPKSFEKDQNLLPPLGD